MNITQEPNGDLQAIIHIQIQEEDYKDKVNEVLKSYRKKANMPGFRPGMVPMGMIKKMYGASVMADEINKLVSEALDKYVYEQKLDILGHPLANMEKTKQIDFDKDKEFDFYFDIALAPEFEVDLKAAGLEIPYYKIIPTDKEIDTAVKDVQNRYGEEIHPDEVAEGDYVSGTFVQLDENGNELEGGYAKEAYFSVNDLKLKKYQKEFIGKKKGDVVVVNGEKAFDKDKRAAVLGNEITDEQLKSDYKFEIKEITRIIPAELNEELFKKVYPDDELKTEEDFRNRIKQDMEKEYAKESDRKFVDDTVKKLSEMIDINLPDEFLKRWLLESNQGQITKEQLEVQYDNYAQTFKWQLIESKLNKQFDNTLNVNTEEVRDQVRGYFGIRDKQSSNDQIEQIVDQVLSNPQEENRIYSNLKTEKLAKVFHEHVKKQEKEVTVDEFLKILSESQEEGKEEKKEMEEKA
jgi:trigger factor